MKIVSVWRIRLANTDWLSDSTHLVTGATGLVDYSANGGDKQSESVITYLVL